MVCWRKAGAARRWQAWDTFLGRKEACPMPRGRTLNSGVASKEEVGFLSWAQLV